MEVAEAAKRIFVCQFPSVAEALGWCDGECDCKDWENTQPCIRID
jgi:thymidylate synthase (FAD)